MDVEATDNAEKREGRRWRGHRITGILLAVVGSLWLARKAGWMLHDSAWVMQHDTGGIMLPVILIILGLLLVFGMAGRNKKTF